MRAKRVPVLPTDEIVHMTIRCSAKQKSPQVFAKRVAGATSDHGSLTFCPRRAHGPCVDTEDPPCGRNLPRAPRKFRDLCGQC